MALKDISDSRVKIYNPFGLYVTPFKNENEKGTETYFLDEVIRDTTTISQEDPTENKIENEFGSAPILNNVQLGAYTFSAEVADMQPELLNALCGYIDDGKKSYAPAAYTPVYAEIALVFKAGETKYVAAILPKVQLNSKATFDSLSTSMGRITLAGTGLNLTVDGKSTPFYLDADYVRVGQIGLTANTVTANTFNVKATGNEFTIATCEWYVDGSLHDDKDTELQFSGGAPNTPYKVACVAKDTSGVSTDRVEIIVTTKAS